MKNKVFRIFAVILLICIAEAQTASIQQAARDAQSDVKTLSEFKWYGAGCLSGGLPFALLSVAIVTNRGEYHTYWHTAAGVISIAPTVYALFRSPPPPPADRFLGKSSAYMDAYTRAYALKVKRVRVLWSAAGCASGVCLGWHTVIPFGYGFLGSSPEGGSL